jgi:hypothetical protein
MNEKLDALLELQQREAEDYEEMAVNECDVGAAAC